jgi:hypothetical protein
MLQERLSDASERAKNASSWRARDALAGRLDAVALWKSMLVVLRMAGRWERKAARFAAVKKLSREPRNGRRVKGHRKTRAGCACGWAQSPHSSYEQHLNEMWKKQGQ